MKKIAVIGAGFSGISAAAYAARGGFEVEVFEKNDTLGGRARQLITTEGFVFDMGPSWYWMPEIIEGFFNDFGKNTHDYFELKKLDPQFEIIFEDGKMKLPGDIVKWEDIFEGLESGAGKKLSAFLDDAKKKYAIAIPEFLEKPGHSLVEYFSWSLGSKALQLNLFSSMRKLVRRYFKNPRIISILEFPVIFLGGSPDKIPAMYNLMNFSGYAKGTWYPMGGFGKVIDAMASIAQSQGVTFHSSSTVSKINIQNDLSHAITINRELKSFDGIIATSDYQSTEQMLPASHRNYSEKYWKTRTFAPSCLIYFLGLKEKLPGLQHHTLFFEPDLDQHLKEIYINKSWPTEPLFYLCCPSKTDNTIVPPEHESLFLLMPIATGLRDDLDFRDSYLKIMLGRIEAHLGVKNLEEKIIFKKSYCISDFESDYNAYQGNAYGLANTLRQTAIRKPKIRNRKIKNLLYAGQLTVPGPGVPPAIISGKIAAMELKKII